jgi:hypothetical protein
MPPAQYQRARILTPEETVVLLKERGIRRSKQTLAKYRSVGGGPPFVSIGGRQIGYPEMEAHDWADSLISGLRRSTSEVV